MVEPCITNMEIILCENTHYQFQISHQKMLERKFSSKTIKYQVRGLRLEKPFRKNSEKWTDGKPMLLKKSRVILKNFKICQIKSELRSEN